MTRGSIFAEVDMERVRQDGLWGIAFDDSNTAFDWVAYITKFAGKSLTRPFSWTGFRECMIKVAALAVAAIEACDRASEREHCDNVAN